MLILLICGFVSFMTWTAFQIPKLPYFTRKKYRRERWEKFRIGRGF